MAAYWLIPISGSDPAVLGAERMRLAAEEGEALRRLAAEVHPRLLMSFKLGLLLGDDEDEACGIAGAGDLPLGEPGDIALTGSFSVSHCGTAFMDRLPSPAEALAIAAALPPVSHVRTLRAWWESGKRAMLLKEE